MKKRLSIFKLIQRPLQTWINQRFIPIKKITLTHRNIFIFPNRYGAAYLMISLILYVLGTNYQNNLILLLAFFLIGLLIITFLHSFVNLYGLIIEILPVPNQYQGQQATLFLQCQSQKIRHQLYFQLQEHPPQLLVQEQEITLAMSLTQRGYNKIPRIKIYSIYPLGLVNCWTYLRLSESCLAYPKPISCTQLLTTLMDGGDTEKIQQEVDEQEDFIGVRNYIPGESLSRVAWKHMAKSPSEQFLTKAFETQQQSVLWLQLDIMIDEQLEEKLGELCFLIDSLSQQQRIFGLKLPTKTIAPSQGEQHRVDCLTALALY